MNWQNPPPEQKQKQKGGKKLKLGKDYKVPKSICPECGTELDMATCLYDNHKPKPGNLTLCIKCGHTFIIGKDLKLREINDKEIVAWAGRPELIQATQILAQVRIRKAVSEILNDIKKEQHD